MKSPFLFPVKHIDNASLKDGAENIFSTHSLPIARPNLGHMDSFCPLMW